MGGPTAGGHEVKSAVNELLQYVDRCPLLVKSGIRVQSMDYVDSTNA